MPDSVDSPAPLKMATLPIRKASTSIPNARVWEHSALLSIGTAAYQLTRRHGNSLPKITLKAKSNDAPNAVHCRIGSLP
jgi:hypothetical protein